MTVQTETSRSGPYAGSGTTGPFTVGFRFLSSAHLQVIRTSTTGIDTTLTLTTDYTVAGAGGASGTVTLVTALATGEKLTIIRDVPYTQLADYVNNDAFPAESHEDALDLLTMQTQQNREVLDRSLTLPATAVGVSTELPVPAADKVIGWDSTGASLVNRDLQDFATAVAFSTWSTETFSGNGSNTVFVLGADPYSASNIDLSVGGVSQTAGINFSYSSATKAITFLTGAPPSGTNNVVARYGQAAVQVTSSFSTETQTATASQTVFNLVTSSYTPGANTLAVFVNGLHLNSGTDFVETDSNTVTFTSGLTAGDEVVFISGRTLNGATGAEAVSYLPAGAGAVATTVQAKLRESVSVKDFGAAGDGSADDTAEVLAALNSGAHVVDGQGLTYKLTANIAPSCENIVIQNATFDISAITTGGSALGFAGTQGSGVALTSNILTGSNSIAVGSTTGFAADDYAWLTSSAVFEVGAGVVLGQIVKVKSVDSGTAITLYEDVLYDFNTADSASIAKLTPKQNITLRNVNFIGANVGIQTAVDFEKCVDVIVDACDFEYVDYVSVLLDRCINSTVTNTSMRYARSVGLAYGVAIGNGCYNVKVANCYGEDTRHMVTVGDNDGVNLFVTVTNCHAASSKDAGIDAHPACDFMVIDGNTVECIASSNDGIIFQGLNCVISNNVVVGNITSSIRHQLLPAIGSGSAVITGNNIINTASTASTDTAIYVDQDTTGTATLDSVVIANNRMDGALENGILVYADGGNIKNVVITSNVMADIAATVGCQIRADAGFSVEDFTITGNVFKCSGTQNLYLLGTTAPNILNGTISGNTIKGGTNGIRMIQTQNVVESGNYNTGATRKVFVDTGSLNVTLDRRQSSVVTMTNSTYTVLDQDEHLIANRAGTITVTLPAATSFPGRELYVKTIQAQLVDSASSNVAPIGDSTAGTAILPATDGAWSLLKSDGTNWIVMQRGT